VTFPASNENQVKSGAVRYALRATLKPATATIRLIVRDRFTGRYGTLDLPVNQIPAGAAVPVQ
jgi:hypothetical protein